MKTSLKNFTKVLLGVAVLGGSAGMAVHAQAQKDAKPEINSMTTRYWINNGSEYELISGPVDPQNHCSEPSEFDCVLQSDDPTVDATFPLEDAENQNVTPHPDSQKGQYTP